MNLFNIPLCWPFKMLPNTSSPGIHFDDDWCRNRIKWFENKNAIYRQKWVKADTTPLQILSSLLPDDLRLYKSDGTVAKSFTWTNVYTATGYSIYQTTFDVSDQAEGVYYLYQRVTSGSIDWKAVSEAIHVKVSWPRTLKITYWHSFNDYDMTWTTGIQMKFRVEAAIMDFDAKRERTDYLNQTHDTTTLKANPYREFSFEVGEASGVAEWVVDTLNRIFCCDNIDIEGMKYQARTGAEGKISRIKGYPLVGWSQDIVPAVNKQSLQFADATPLAPGIVVAYNIETGFFGPAALVPILEVESQ